MKVLLRVVTLSTLLASSSAHASSQFAEPKSGVACQNVAIAISVIKLMISDVANARLHWREAVEVKACRKVTYDGSLVDQFDKVRSDFRAGPWMYSFYRANTGEVLVIARKLKIIARGPVETG